MQAERVYSVLLVSAAEKMNTRLETFFAGGGFEPVTVVDSVAKAQRRLLNREYDLVIVNSPLPDDFGKKLAVDVVTESGGVSLLLVKSDMYDEISSSMIPRGVMVAISFLLGYVMMTFVVIASDFSCRNTCRSTSPTAKMPTRTGMVSRPSRRR